VRRSDSFPLVLIGGVLSLYLLFHTAWGLLFEDWLKHQLEQYFGFTFAELIERFGDLAFPLLAASGTVWFLYRYIKAELAKENTAALASRIQFVDEITKDQQFPLAGRLPIESCSIGVCNPGNYVAEKCLVKIEAITGTDGVRQEIQAVIPTSARQEDGRVGWFILGPNEKKLVPITSRSANALNTYEVQIKTDNGTFGLENGGAYLVELIAIAESGAPERRLLDIKIAKDAKVTIAWRN
jgi:hypothetical protein